MHKLFEKGADPFLTNSAGWTILHAAVNANDWDTFDLLCKKLSMVRLKVLVNTLLTLT